MNQLDKDYQSLLRHILINGVEKADRTGTGTLSIFGWQIRHKMKDGFPLLTTKKMAWKSIVTELLWFLRGDTNIKYLVDNGCHIWDGDALKAYRKHELEEFNEFSKKNPSVLVDFQYTTQEEFINKIKTDDEFASKWGELGKIYGRQWRRWELPNYSIEHVEYGYDNDLYVDQIANLISELKTNPDSRRLMVNAWNVGELDQMVLPPCHYGFQVYTRELTISERIKWVLQNTDVEMENLAITERAFDPSTPSRAISLMWNQRSVDTFLGLPFNIASYGLLLEIIAKEVNMIPEELIGNLGDVHLYLNHISQAREQIGSEYTPEDRANLLKEAMGSDEYTAAVKELMPFGGGMSEYYAAHNIPRTTRDPYPLPTLKIELFDKDNHYIGDKDDISEYSIDQFKLENYQSHPSIKAPLSN